MQFKNVALLLSLLTSGVLAAPTKRAASALVPAASFADISISAGTAGNAQQEAQALIADLPADLSTVSADQLDTLEANRKIAESAETDGFNPAIAAASGDTTALDNGKIKNKVLKLTLEVAGLQIQQAQGDDVADKITQEQTKLNKNISLDQAAAGQASQTVDV